MKKSFYDITFDEGKEHIDYSTGNIELNNNATGTSFNRILSKLERNISKGKVSNFEFYSGLNEATCCVTTLDSSLNESEIVYSFKNISEEKLEKLSTLNKYANSEKSKKKCEEYKSKKKNSFGGIFNKNLITCLKELSIPRIIATFPITFVIAKSFMAFSPDLLTRRIAALPLFLLSVNAYPIIKSIISSVKEHETNKKMKKLTEEEDEEVEEETEEIENKDEKVKVKEEILQETKQISSLIDGLEDETAAFYKKELFEHLTEYMNGIDTKPENKNEINLTINNDFTDDVKYLTYLYDLKNRVIDQIRKEEYKSTIEELRSQMITSPEEEKEEEKVFSDDEYTDDLDDSRGMTR